MAGLVTGAAGARRPPRLRLAILWVCALALPGCTPPESRGAPAAQGGGIAVHSPAVTEPAGGVAALYLTAVDTEGRGDRLLGASCPAASAAQLHRTRRQGGLARMAPVEAGIAVPPGGELVLEPGGYHVMLTGLEPRSSAGDGLEVTLVFERAGRLTLRAPVVPVGDVPQRPE